MHLSIRGDNPLDRLLIYANLTPLPAAMPFSGMAVSGVLIAGARLGLFDRLAQRPGTAEELALDLKLNPESATLLLEGLRTLGYLKCRQGAYALTRRARRWLDPTSDIGVGRFIASHHDYWMWWAALPEVVRTGAGIDVHHSTQPDDPFWDRYIRGQFEVARLSAPYVSKALKLPRQARRVLDVGGGHGWYAAELCRRHSQLRATVVDLPGSVAIGKQTIAEAGMSVFANKAASSQ